MWQAELGVLAEDAVRLADTYPLSPSVIHAVSLAARARSTGRDPSLADIRDALRGTLDDALGDHARRIVVTQSWDDIVVSSDARAEVATLLATIAQRRTVLEDWGFAAKVGRGIGVAALFTGPPGTGKTMIAGLIANELGLELYQVDLAKIVSKWVGETEKALGAVFDAAEAGGAILLFDEADALFAKRTEIRGSNDRYANLETNYLLQRIDSFTGVCLLTSNHDANVDPAFRRRLAAHIRLDVPGEQERAQLWALALPARTPVEGSLDPARLARRYPMSGGHIKNAALRAAYLAAHDGSAVTMRYLEHAARQEYEALGKLAP
jgi:SpoVK/Ycf46/Vps4 family AAA+-type ATPase